MAGKAKRHIVLGVVTVGLAFLAIAILVALPERNESSVPRVPVGVQPPPVKKAFTTVGGTTTLHVGDQLITVTMPKAVIKNDEDLEKYRKRSLNHVREQQYKMLAAYPEEKRQAFIAKFVEKEIKKRESEIEKLQSGSLWDFLSENKDEKQKEQIRRDFDQMTEEQKADSKQKLISELSENLAEWKGGKGQKKFEAHLYEQYFTPPKPLTEEQQLAIDKQVTKHRLKNLRDGTFEKNIREGIQKGFDRMVESGKFPKSQAKKAVEVGIQEALRREREWAASVEQQ